MRSVSDVERVAAELSTGANAAEVARRTGIPWRTVRKWQLAGIDDVLARHRHRAANGGGGVPCAECLLIERAPLEAYAHLLGQYLGDGTVVRHPRTWRLEIFSDAASSERRQRQRLCPVPLLEPVR